MSAGDLILLKASRTGHINLLTADSFISQAKKESSTDSGLVLTCRERNRNV